MQEIIKDSSIKPMDKKTALGYKLNNDIAIKLDQLRITYNINTAQEILVLNPTSIEFPKNKIYFIIGDSGSGKTTLVTHFNGLLKSNYGNIFIENSKIIGKKRTISKFKKLRKSVGMVFQFPEYQLFKDTVIKDVMFGPKNLEVKKADAKNLAMKYISMLGLSEEYYQRSPFALSGGQKRRVAIAGILSIEPQILVFDEPTAGLDPDGMREMLDIFKNLKKENKTVFVITHDMNHVLEIADQVILLKNNEIAAIDEPYKIFRNNDLMGDTSIVMPHIIQTINQLIKINKKFELLYELKPRTIQQLSEGILKVLGK